MAADSELIMERRKAIKVSALAIFSFLVGGSILKGLSSDSPSNMSTPSIPMKLTCIIRYQIDPFQRDAFRQYCENWKTIIPRCGGYLVGYFMPSEGTNDVAWGLIAFDSLASYETYRSRLKADQEGRANFEFAQSRKLVLREERNFVEIVDGTLGLQPTFSAG